MIITHPICGQTAEDPAVGRNVRLGGGFALGGDPVDARDVIKATLIELPLEEILLLDKGVFEVSVAEQCFDKAVSVAELPREVCSSCA